MDECQHSQDFRAYANDSFKARLAAIDKIAHLQVHPHAIYSIQLNPHAD